jgi:hypothetical protein
MKGLWLVFLCVLGVSGAACNGPDARPWTKKLPAGDAESGREAFIRLQCHSCHEVVGGNLPAPSIVPAVGLGGRKLLPPSPDRIAQDILLPSSHFAAGYPVDQITADDRSRMPDYSKVLSDQEVANLVTFLASRYSRGLPSATR